MWQKDFASAEASRGLCGHRRSAFDFRLRRTRHWRAVALCTPSLRILIIVQNKNSTSTFIPIKNRQRTPCSLTVNWFWITLIQVHPGCPSSKPPGWGIGLPCRRTRSRSCYLLRPLRYTITSIMTDESASRSHSVRCELSPVCGRTVSVAESEFALSPD